MGLFGDNTTITTTFAGKDNLSPVVRGMRATLANFKRDAAMGFGIGAGISVWGLATKGIGMVTDALGDAFEAFKEAEAIAAQTDQTLKTTGGVANVTAGDVARLATSIRDLGGVDDEAVQAGENLLLTFTNIRNELGRDNDIFDQTTRIMVDMSRALGQDMKSSAIQLGKALNDPIRGITALRRVGVSFSTDQTKLIAKLAKTGDLLGAQKVILEELNREFGGSESAFGRTAAGRVERFNSKLGDLSEGLGSLLADAILPVIDGLESLGGAWHDLELFVSPHLALQEELNDAIREAAEVRGLDADVIIEYRDRLEALQKAKEGQAFTDRLLEDDARRLLGFFGELTDEQQAQVDAIVANTRASDQQAETIKDLTAEAEAAIKAFEQAGGATVAWAEQLHDLPTSADTAAQSMQLVADAIDEAKAASKGFKKAIVEMAVSTHDRLTDMRSQVKEDMADIMWVMRHPFAEENLEHWIKRKLDKVAKMRRKADRQGNTDAIADLDAFTEKWRPRWEELVGITRGEVNKIKAIIGSIGPAFLDVFDFSPPPPPPGGSRGGPRYPRWRRRHIGGTEGHSGTLALMAAPAAAMGASGGGDVYLYGEKVGRVLDRYNGRALAMYGVSARG